MDASPWLRSNGRPKVPKGRQEFCPDQPVVPPGLCAPFPGRVPGLTSGACACHRFAIPKNALRPKALARTCDSFTEAPALKLRYSRTRNLTLPRCHLPVLGRDRRVVGRRSKQINCFSSRTNRSPFDSAGIVKHGPSNTGSAVAQTISAPSALQAMTPR